MSSAVSAIKQRRAAEGAQAAAPELVELRDKVSRLEALIQRLHAPAADAPAAASSPAAAAAAAPHAPPAPKPLSWKRRACSTALFLLSLAYFCWLHASARLSLDGKPRALIVLGSGGGGARTSAAAAARPASPSAAPCDPLQPLRPADLPPTPQAYAGNATGRSLYITVLTADHADVLLENWPSQEEFLLAPWDSHFMLAVPERDGDAMVALVTARLGWRKVMDFTAPQATYPCEGAVDMAAHAGAGWYRSPRGVTILLVVRRFRRPAFIDNATFHDLAKPCGLLKCCQKDGSDAHRVLEQWEVDQSTEFSTINLAFVHHLLVDMDVVDNYDYIFKVDADIRFHFQPPGSPGDIMRDTGCVIMQSEILEVGSHLHCIQPLLGTIQRFADHHGIEVKSKKHGAWGEGGGPQRARAARALAHTHALPKTRTHTAGWCEQMNLYIYGNFVGFWRPFVRAPAQRAFSRWLFENDRLYYNYNDQGSSRAYLCMWYDVAYLNSRAWGGEGRRRLRATRPPLTPRPPRPPPPRSPPGVRLLELARQRLYPPLACYSPISPSV